MTVLRLGRRAMGTSFEVLLIGEDETRLRSAAEEAFAEIDRLEGQMSLYLPGSELSRINERAAEEAVPVEPGLFGLLRRAREIHRETEGAFDISVVPRWAGRLWGMRHVALENGAVRFRRGGIAVDLGGIGKGYAVERAASLLRARGVESGFLHAGTSTIYALGAPPGEPGWRVGIVDPRDPERRLGSLLLRDQALSTSSPSGKLVPVGKKLYGHVIDPRDGEPAKRVCAWALCPSPADSDALATAFLVLGPEGSRPYLERHPEAGAIFLHRKLVTFRVRFEPLPSKRIEEGVGRRDFLRGAAAAVAAFSVGITPRRAAAQETPKGLQVAVIGTGEQGQLLLSHLARMKGVQVRAVCDVQEANLKRAIGIAGRSVESYEDYSHLLEEEALDAVVVATPTHLHAGPAVAALANGCHVFCEAPLAHTVEDCKKIVAAAREAKRIFHAGHQRRSSKLFPHALSHIRSGAIGKILQLRATWNQKQSWRRVCPDPAKDKLVNWRLYRESSGGLLVEQGSHVLDLANWYLGSPPEAVTGIGGQLLWKDGREVEDSVQAIFRYPGGVQLHLQASLVSSYGGESELVVGDAACILLLDQRKGLLFKEADTVAAGWEQYAKKEMLGDARGIILDAEATKYAKHEGGEEIGPQSDKADYFAELEDFFSSIRKGEPSKCGVKPAMRAAVAAIVAAEAVAKGTWIGFTKDHFEVGT